jgi:hypothetical protein
VVRGLLVLVFAACARVAAAPSAPAPAPVQHPLGAPLAIPGESMVFELTFRGLQVARVQVAIGQPGWVDGKPSIIVKSHGETDGLVALIGELDWTLATTMHLVDGTPLLVEEDAIIKFRGKTDTNHERSTDARHTIHSAVCVLRGWRSRAGQEGSLAMRVDQAHIELRFHEAAREFLEVAGKPAVRYDGVARGKFPFKIWISDDTARVPLRLETSTKWGDVAVELVEYNAPRD